MQPRQIIRITDLPAPPAGLEGWPWTEEAKLLPPSGPGGQPWPRITVVTPSFNQGKFIEETIRSVLLQGYPNLEYIVVDGGSTDQSVEVIRKYTPFLDYWGSEPDSGQANAINKGFYRSTGEIMGWLNSDDFLLPRALERIAAGFINHPSDSIVTGFRKVYDQQGRFARNFINDLPTNYYIRHYCPICQETTYWRRSLWKKLGPLDEEFHYAMDYEFWLRALDSGYSFRLLPSYLGAFRDHPEGKSSTWQDVYQRDMNALYARYNLGASEADILASLGRQWPLRYDFLAKFGCLKLSDYPRLVIVLFNLLENQVICDVALSLYKAVRSYRAYKRNTEALTGRQWKTPRLALSFAAHTLKLIRRRLLGV